MATLGRGQQHQIAATPGTRYLARPRASGERGFKDLLDMVVGDARRRALLGAPRAHKHLAYAAEIAVEKGELHLDCLLLQMLHRAERVFIAVFEICCLSSNDLRG